MKQGRTLTELGQEIVRQNNIKEDMIANTSAIKMVDSAIDDGQDVYPLLPLAEQQIGARVGIPTKYYNRMKEEAPELLSYNVNHWFQNKPENRMLRVLDGNVRAFLSDRYMRKDNYDLMMNILPVLKDISGLQVTSCEVTEQKLYLKVTTPKLQTEVRKDDIVQAGLVISNSEVGLGAFKVQPMILRLVCTNGMIADTYGISKYHVGKRITIEDDIQTLYSNETLEADDRAFWLKTRDVVAGALREETFMQIVGKLMEATENPIRVKPTLTIERLSNRFQLSKDEGDMVLHNLLRESDMTMYGLSNAVTATAKEDSLSYDRATELEQLGGSIITLSNTDWRELAA